jgi:hypothetical protein
MAACSADAKDPAGPHAGELDSGTGTGGGDTGTHETADAGPEVEEDSGPPESHEGKVPVFVAAGYGTRRTVSCDLGLTWKADTAAVPNGGDDQYLARGLAYGKGRFVVAVGGSGTRNLDVSEDGVTWKRHELQGNGFSDVAYGNGRFVAGGGHASLISLDGGDTWVEPGTMGSGGILRHLGFGNYKGGRFVAAGDQGRRMSSADGVTWGSQVAEGSFLGDVAYGARVFVVMTNGAATRYSEDGGESWQSGTIAGAGTVTGLHHDGARFIATTNGNTFTSLDGKKWDSHAASGPGIAGIANNDERTHYAGFVGGDLYHSTDGIVFARVSQGGQGFTRIEFGWVNPSSVCPLR